jgi:hypothetical protein
VNNSILLKRAMKVLNLTGVSLAEKVTALREDDKRTAPETISRWLTGTNQPDPFLMGWITELVRSKLRNSGNDAPILYYPNSNGLIIAVTNAKGGVGTTTVAMNLAAIAKKSLRAKTTIIFADGEKSTQRDKCREDMADLLINSPALSPEEVLNYEPTDGEIVIVDVSTALVTESIDWKSSPQKTAIADSFLCRFQPDIYLIPVDLDGYFDVKTTADLMNSGALQAPVQILHRPRGMTLTFADTAMKGGLDVSSEVFCPFFIPQSISPEFHFPRTFISEWQNPEQEHYHYELFEHLLKFIGGEIGEATDGIEGMTLAELLDLAESR